MRVLKISTILVIASFILTGCGTFQGQTVSVIEYPPTLEAAHRFYKERSLKRAEAEVQRYLGTTSDVYYHGYAYLLLGEIREASGQEAGAAEAYKQVVSHAAGYHATSLAEGLYRLSWVYEREQKYDELLVVLLDLQRNLRAGDNFIKHVEIPARLANTYYVLGQWDKALAERARVSNDTLEKYKNHAKSQENIVQAKLYRSFHVLKPSSTTPEKNLAVIELTQKELLDIGEMGPFKMAERAFQAIEQAYQREFFKLKKTEKFRTPVETEAGNRKRIEEWAALVDLMEDLKADRRPAELAVNASQSLQFFEKLAALETESKRHLQNLEVGIRKASKDNNPSEAPPPKPKKLPPAKNRAH